MRWRRGLVNSARARVRVLRIVLYRLAAALWDVTLHILRARVYYLMHIEPYVYPKFLRETYIYVPTNSISYHLHHLEARAAGMAPSRCRLSQPALSTPRAGYIATTI